MADSYYAFTQSWYVQAILVNKRECVDKNKKNVVVTFEQFRQSHCGDLRNVVFDNYILVGFTFYPISWTL